MNNKFQPQIYRNKVMYAKDVVEIEVKSTEEACAQLWKGQERRRKAATILNDKSSRSHSVFNIRLVQVGLLLREIRLLFSINDYSLVRCADKK